MTTIEQKVKNKGIRPIPLMIGTFALTYYLFIALLALVALMLNRYILDWAGLSNSGGTFVMLPAWTLILIVFLINALVLAGIISYIRTGKKMMYLIFGTLLLVVQIFIGGLDGWQKLLLEGFLLSLILVLSHGKMAVKTENGAEEAG